MQDNPFYTYYATELSKWEEFAKTHQLSFKDKQLSEYGLSFELRGEMLNMPFRYSSEIRYNNASNNVIPVRSRILGNGNIELSDNNSSLFLIYNQPNFWKRRKAKQYKLLSTSVGAYSIYSRHTAHFSDEDGNALGDYKIKQIEATKEKTQVKVFKYLAPEELKDLLEFYTLLKEKAR